MTASQPPAVTPARRPGLGLLVGLAVLVLVAVPAAVSAYFSLLGFVGWNSDPEPAVGALWGAIALLLLALPVLAGLVTAGVPLWRGRRVAPAWVAAGAVTAVVLAWWMSRVV